MSSRTTAELTPASLRVASVPSRHPYLDHIHDSRVTLVTVDTELPEAGKWVPPALFESAWITEHADHFDVYHLHFGTESYSVEHVRGVIAALQEVGRPLVYTAHDLVNPQLTDQRHHRRQLDVLIPAADAVITLTRGAATEIADSWDRSATVIPHPEIVPVTSQFPPAPVNRVAKIGVQLRDLRPNVDGPGTVENLAKAIDLLGAQGITAIGVVEINTQVRDQQALALIRELCAGSNVIELRERPRPTDPQLYTGLNTIDVALLPYSHGTHSGWIEMCWDLGIPVAGPALGHFAEQHPEAEFYHRFDREAGPLSVALALAAALRSGRAAARPLTAANRRRQRDAQRPVIADAHFEVYQSVLGPEEGN